MPTDQLPPTATSPMTARWIKRRKPTGQVSLRLLCCPYAGAGSSAFLRWARAFPPGIELCAVEAPGRENRLAEEPFTRMGPLVEELADAITPLRDRPMAFFGHSFGALVAFELARELRRREAALPTQLVVSACPPPHSLRAPEVLHTLSDEALVERVTQLGGMPPEVTSQPGLLRWVLSALRADFEVIETYEVQRELPLSCPLTALGGTDDPYLSPARLTGWCRYTHGRFGLHLFPGSHFFLHDAHGTVVPFILQTLRDVA